MERSVNQKRLETFTLAAVASFFMSMLPVANVLMAMPVFFAASTDADRRRSAWLPPVIFLLVFAWKVFGSRETLNNSATWLSLAVESFVPFVIMISAGFVLLLDGRRFPARILSCCAVSAVAGFTLIALFSTQKEAAREFSEMYRKLTMSFFPNMLEAEIDRLYSYVVMVAAAILVPMGTGFAALSAYMGDLFLLRNVPDAEERTTHWRLADSWIWVFLLSWAAVVALKFLNTGTLPSILVLNVALTVSLLYYCDGLSVIAYRVRAKNPLISGRRVISPIVLISLLLPGLGTVLLVALMLLGVSETWIELRH